MCTHAQIEWNDTVHTISITGYAGVLGGPKVSVDSNGVTGGVSLRIGGTGSIAPVSWFSLYGLVACDIDETVSVTPWYLIAINLKPSRNTTFTFGKTPSPMADIRPVTTTMSGQFEAWTQAQIPGSAIGGKISLVPKKDFLLTAGGFWRGNDASVELGLRVPYTKFAAYYMVRSKNFGAAVDVSYKWLSQVVVYNHKQNIGFFTSLTIPKTSGVALYSDVGFDTNNWKILRGEWGIFKVFSYKMINIIIAGGYSEEIRSVKGYMMISL